MFDFPNSPTPGQVATTPAGATFTWDGTKWVAGGATTVSIAAGTGIVAAPNPITGSGTVSLSVPVAITNGGTNAVTAGAGADNLHGFAGAGAGLVRRTGAAAYALDSAVYLVSPVNLTSQVTGVLPIANGGTGSSTAAAAPFVEIAGDVMTGLLEIKPAAADPMVFLNKPNGTSGRASAIAGAANGLWRWSLTLGDGGNEAGSQSGSDLKINRYNDAGTFVDAPLTINRATGNVTMPGEVSVGAAGKITNGGGYTQIFTGAQAAVILGIGADPSNYGRNTTHVWQNAAASATYAIFNAGGTQNVSGAWQTISDAAAKINVAPYMTGLDVLLELQPVSFSYRGGFGDNGARTRVGLIAQQIAPLLPEIVGKSGDLMTLEPGNLIYCLINSIKTLAARVAVLEGK